MTVINDQILSYELIHSFFLTEQAAEKVKEVAGTSSAEARGKTSELTGETKGKAAEMQGKAKGKVEETKEKL